jgi:hypothetical protein
MDTDCAVLCGKKSDFATIDSRILRVHQTIDGMGDMYYLGHICVEKFDLIAIHRYDSPQFVRITFACHEANFD